MNPENDSPLRSQEVRTISLLPSSSVEQNNIVSHLKQGHNVIVDAIAGSGKSTTIITVAKALPNKRFLQLTYNAMLRKEFRQTLEKQHIHNIDVHTFHSLGVRHFTSEACTDMGLRRVLYENLPMKTPIPTYDVCVLDECQDMTPLYYHFIKHTLQISQHHIQLLFLGDYMQCLYEFKGADARFLTMAESLWNQETFLRSTTFISCTLNMSYRVTNQMASFINEVMLGENRLRACRDGVPVYYLRNSRSNIEKIVIYHIKRILAEGDLPSDIFVLGPSVRGTMSNIRKLENSFVESDIPCHVPVVEGDKMDERVMEGKVVFSTFHAVKGRQRKYVFVVGFDQHYFSMYGRHLSPLECPNTLYVACTRATHQLFLLETNQWSTDRPLLFLKKSHHEMKQTSYIEFKGTPQTTFWEREHKEEKEQIHRISVTDLIRFIPENIMEHIAPKLLKLFVRIDDSTSNQHRFSNEDIPGIVQFRNGLFEDVSDLNGMAIPSMFYDHVLRTKKFSSEVDKMSSVLYQLILSEIRDMRPNEHVFLRQMFDTLPTSCHSISDYLYVSNMYSSFQERLYYKLKQIDVSEYTWLSEPTMKRCMDALSSMFTDVQTFMPEVTILNDQMEYAHSHIDTFLEHALSSSGTQKPTKFRFKARVDLITDTELWEFKCCSALSIDHFLQLIIYAWLWNMIPNHIQQSKRFYLYNIKTGERWELIGTLEDWSSIVVALLKGKYQTQETLNDDSFVRLYSSE